VRLSGAELGWLAIFLGLTSAILLFILFIALKLDGNLDFTWDQVFLPTYISLIGFWLCMFGVGVAGSLDIQFIQNWLLRKFHYVRPSTLWCGAGDTIMSAYATTVIGLVTVWSFMLAAKLDDTSSLSWMVAFTPLWIFYFVAYLFTGSLFLWTEMAAHATGAR